MTEASGRVVLIAHLPGVRMIEDAVGILEPGTELQRLPWDQYYALTGGAHDRPSEYLSGDPVVLVSEAPAELVPPTEMGNQISIEMKSPSHSFDMLGFLPNPETIAWALDLTSAVWTCLSLARPLSSFISPRLSTFFLVPQDGMHFATQDGTASLLQVQGDADHEYLFAARFAAAPLTRDQIDLADSMKYLLGPIQTTPPLAGALRTFLDAQDPSLGRMEQAVLCTAALEELLLRGNTTGLRKGMTEALSALVPEAQRGDVSDRALKGLYDLRSDFLHGRSKDIRLPGAQSLGLAPQLLARALWALGSSVLREESLDGILAFGPDALTKVALQGHWQEADGFRVEDRISGHRSSMVVSATGRMNAPEETTLIWSPLLGLNAPPKGFILNVDGPDMVLPLTIEELSDLEDKDIRRDFFQNKLSLIRLEMVQDEGHSAFVHKIPDGQLSDLRARSPIDYPNVRALTIALRALGYSRFLDPLLLGEFRYHESTRLRLPTVYRQTLLSKNFEAADSPEQKHWTLACQLSHVVLRIADQYPVIDRLLTLQREAHFHPVLREAVRARLCFAFLDGVIGRLNGDGVARQIAAIGQTVAPGELGDWFARDARGIRNRLSHSGDTEVSADDFSQLLAFTDRLALSLIRHVGASAEDGPDPAKDFRVRLIQ